MELNYNKRLTIANFLVILQKIILIAIAVIVAIDYWTDIFDFSVRDLTILTIATIGISYTMLCSIPNYNKWGFHMVVLTYTFLCHFGLLIASYIDPVTSKIRSDNSLRFMKMNEYSSAIEISLFACLLFVIFTKYRKRSTVDQEEKDKISENKNEKLLESVFYIGILIQLVGGAYLAYNAIKYFGVPYATRVDLTNSSQIYGHVQILLSYAFCMMIAVLPYEKWKYGLYLYILIACSHFILGNRGEVLYSALCCSAVYYLNNKKLSNKLILVGIALIIFVPFIRDFRTFATTDNYNFGIKKSVLEFLAEVGFQIAPLTYTVEIVNSGFSHKFGGTYLYGIADFFIRKIPLIGKSLPSSSELNIKYIMPQKGLGYSQIAEMFYNFGFVGAGIAYITLSKLLIKFEKIFISVQTSIYKKIFVTLMVVEIINLTRNSSGTLGVYLAYIGVLLVCIYFFSKFRLVK